MGPKIIDSNGRIGIVTEDRGDGVFARPETVPYTVESAGLVAGVSQGTAITATWWAKQEDGTYSGLWYDDPMHTERTASLMGGA